MMTFEQFEKSCDALIARYNFKWGEKYDDVLETYKDEAKALILKAAGDNNLAELIWLGATAVESDSSDLPLTALMLAGAIIYREIM